MVGNSWAALVLQALRVAIVITIFLLAYSLSGANLGDGASLVFGAFGAVLGVFGAVVGIQSLFDR